MPPQMMPPAMPMAAAQPAAASQPAAATPAEATKEDPKLTDEERFLAKLKDKPGDFSASMGLLELVLKADPPKSLEETTAAFESFLAEFPLCYGYWKKYCDAQTKTGGYDEGIKILHRGITAIPNSIDLWSFFCTFVAFHSEDLDAIRDQFEMAIAAVGMNYHAEKLWVKYIEFEASQEEWDNVTKLFHRVLDMPHKALETFWDKFTKHANEHPPDAASPQEYMKKWEGVCEEAKKKRSETQHWEDTCRRTYYHANPLDDAQLAAWREYLAHAETTWKEDSDRIVGLYERCVVPCCIYPEFWIKYAKFVETKRNDVGAAREVLSRASRVHLKYNPEMVFAHALFEERHNDMERAKGLYQYVLEDLSPALVEGVVSICNFHRRQGDNAAVCAAYEAGLSAQAEASEGLGYLAAHYARFCTAVLGDVDKATKVYADAAPKAGGKLFWLAYLEANRSNADMAKAVFDQAVGEGSKLNSEGKEELWEWYIDFLQDFGTLVAKEDAEKAFKETFPAEGNANNKKRPAGEAAGPAEAAKQPKVEEDAAAAAAAAAWQQQQAAQWAAYGQQQQYYAGYPPAAYPAY